MNCFAKKTSAILLFALGVAWGAEAVHSSMIPHFYCADHQIFTHEGHDHSGTNSVQTEHSEDHSDAGCELTLFSHQGAVVVNSSAVTASVTYLVSLYPLLSRSISQTDRFWLAPKNSPPV